MPTVRNAMLCNAATAEPTGLVSMLGAFLDTVSGVELPIRVMLWLVARIELDDAELGEHGIAVSVTGDADRQEIARAEGVFHAEGGPLDPELPAGGNLILPLPVEFGTEGVYRVRLSVDGREFWTTALRARLSMPPL